MTKTEEFINGLPDMFVETKKMTMEQCGQNEDKAELSALMWIKALVSTEIEFFDFKLEMHSEK